MTTTNVAPDLADKVADREALQQSDTAVEKRGKTIFDLIRDQQGGFARVLPDAITAERFTRVAITEVRKNRALANCDPMSLLGSLMLSAQLGLEPGGPLGHAYLVPFGKEVTFIVGYKGLIDLARRSGHIASIYAEPVFEGDEFSWSLGLHRDITHVPVATERHDPDKVTHVYAVARFREEGAEPAFIVLTRAQVESFRARSRAGKKGPWVTDWIAMALKTAVRRLSTWLPMSVNQTRALAADGQTITKIDVEADDFIDVDGEENETSAAEVEGPASDPEPTEPPPPPAGSDAADRMKLASKLRDGALKANQAEWSAFANEHEIPTDARKWTPEHAEAVIGWATAEPATDTTTQPEGATTP